MVVFLLFCGLHNEAGDSKFRNRRQYIAYVGHVGGWGGCGGLGWMDGVVGVDFFL